MAFDTSPHHIRSSRARRGPPSHRAESWVARWLSRRTTSRPGYRPDIDGLRALAVLAVLGDHAGVPALAGGYVGVDVFFVISGFLSTGLLVAELDRTGRISLGGFYARRVRRLLPAAVTVLLAVAIASAVLLPPVQRADV